MNLTSIIAIGLVTTKIRHQNLINEFKNKKNHELSTDHVMKIFRILSEQY
jgi:hypothetical protein